jgi:hypothetical protein
MCIRKSQLDPAAGNGSGSAGQSTQVKQQEERSLSKQERLLLNNSRFVGCNIIMKDCCAPI